MDQAELISAAQAGDRTAFDELVRQTYVDTYTLALRLCSDEEDARDVVQDAYLRAWRSIGSFRGDAAFSTWMYRITANCAATFVTKRRRLRTEPLPTHLEPADLHPESQPEGMAESSRRPRPGGPGARRPAAEAAGGRGAEGRLRHAPRGDRRRARHLGLGGQGPAAPGPAPPARRPVRGDEVVPCGMRTSPSCSPASSTAPSRSTTAPASSSSPTCAARPSSPATGKLLRTLEQLRTRYFEPSPGLLAATLTALAEEGERRVVHSIITGKRLAVAGAALAGVAAAGAAAPP